MDADEIMERVGFAVEELGFKALVLQSGEDPSYTDGILVDIVKRIRDKYGILLFMSIGERSFECYKRLYEAGAYGALLRFETSNKNIYSMMRPGKKLEERLELIKKLINHGFIVATGFLLGLPGTTKEDIMKDILLTKSLKPDMYSFGPLIPHPCTPLADAQKVGTEDTLKAIALSRLLDHEAKILVTTSLETLHPEGKRKGLMAGGNSLMINVTPEKYRNSYEIYPGKAGNEAAVQDTIRETLDLLYSLGRAPTDLGV
jgi:biotin synthase